MFTVSLANDFQKTIDSLTNLQREQLPFATAKSLTLTAGMVKDAEQKEMRAVFDRPTPWTLNSLFTKPATKQNLSAYVWLKDDRASGTPPDKYLTPEIKGGRRVPKGFEAALQRIGALPSGWVAVPGAEAKIDGFGNMDRSQLVQVLGYLQSFGFENGSKNLSDKRKASLARGTKRKVGFVYFVGRPGNGRLPMGVWQQFTFAHGVAIKPILIFVPKAQYSERLNFDRVAQETVQREFGGQFKAALSDALRTARS